MKILIKNTKTIECKIFALIVVLQPLLSIYKSIFSGMDLGFALLFFSSIYYLPRLLYAKNHVDKSIKKSLAFAFCISLYLFLISLLSFFIGEDINGNAMNDDHKNVMVFRIVKFFYTSFYLIIAGKQFFAFDFAVKALKIVSIITVSYLLLQLFCFNSFKTVLPPFIKGFTKENYDYILHYNYHIKNIGFFRPMSLFYEPAHFSEFNIIVLAACLFLNRLTNKKNLVLAIYITLGIVLSTSGIGILTAGIMWLTAIARAILMKRDVKIHMIILMLGIICFSMFLLTPLGKNTIDRLFMDNGAVSIRILAGIDSFYNMPAIKQIFGIGFGNYAQGSAVGLPYILICFGGIGALLLFIFNIYVIVKTNGFSRIFTIIIFILSFMTMTVTLSFSFYFVFILYNKEGYNIKRFGQKQLNKGIVDYNNKIL